MPKDGRPFTGGELRDLAGHLIYEFNELRNAHEHVTLDLDPRTDELVAVAGFVHARNLLVFFDTTLEIRDNRFLNDVRAFQQRGWRGTPQADVVAGDYVPHWWRSALADSMEEAEIGIDVAELKRMLNRKVMHVGRGRLDDGRRLHIETAWRALEAVWAYFMTEVAETQWGDMFPV